MTEQSKSITVEQARAAVLASGELESFDGPHFLADATSLAEWLPYFLGDGAPVLARVRIKRRGQEVREVVVSWAEYEAQDQPDPTWNDTRAAKPMTIFGAEVERHAYRVVFADVLAPLLEAVPSAQTGDPWAPAPDAAPARDWDAELAALESPEAVDALWPETKGQRTAALERAFRLRRKQLSEPVLAPGGITVKLGDGSAISNLLDHHGVTPETFEPLRRKAESAAMPSPTPRPPKPGVPSIADPVKPVGKRAKSRADRDTGRRGGGRS